MEITIGINANHADSSICIFSKNKLIFAIEEERLNKIKHWAGVPIESLKQGLEYCNIKTSDVKNVTLNTNPFSNLNKKIPYYLTNFLFSKNRKKSLKEKT